MANNTGRKKAGRTAAKRRTAKAPSRDIGAEIIEGLELAIRYERGEKVGARVKEVAISAREARVDPAPQFDREGILALRQRLRLTQPVFAQLLSVSPETVKGWEQGRFVPQGAANRLLQVCRACPEAILDVAHLLETHGAASDRRSGRDRKSVV